LNIKKLGVPLVLLALAVIVVLVWRWTTPAPDAPVSIDAARPPTQAASALAAAMAPVPRTSAWEFCGASSSVPRDLERASSVSAVEVFALLPPALGSQALAAARQRMLDALRAGDTRSRGAAIVLKNAAAANAAQRAMAGPALARLAHETDDATVMGWAVSLCMGASGADHCGGLDGSDWQALEPDNAAGGMAFVAEEAEARDEVMRSLPQARRYWLHAGQMVAAAIKAVPRSEPGYLRLALALEAAVQEAGVLEPLMKGIAEACRPAPAAGTPRQGECDALARLMVERGDSLRAQAVGLRVGELAGWPAARLASLRAEHDTLAALSPAYDPQQPFSCTSVEAGLRWFEDVAREGEPHSLRQRR
jgi:hypothetical protein